MVVLAYAFFDFGIAIVKFSTFTKVGILSDDQFRICQMDQKPKSNFLVTEGMNELGRVLNRYLRPRDTPSQRDKIQKVL